MRINGVVYTRESLAALIDQTILVADATQDQVIAVCRKSVAYGFKSVCTNLFWTTLVAGELRDSKVDVCYTVGFPLGAIPTSCKVFEAMEGIRVLSGKTAAIDMVANIGLLKSGEYKAYTDDIRQVVKAGHDSGLEVKAILETGLLTEAEIKEACICAVEAGVDFVKTGTGKGGTPQVSDVMIMRKTVPANVGVKFSGFGTCSPTQLTIMGIKAGANRLGSPVGAQIIEEADQFYKDISI